GGIVVDDVDDLIDLRQAPFGIATQRDRVHVFDVRVRIAFHREPADRLDGTRQPFVAAVALGVRVVPVIRPLEAAHAAGGLDFPEQTGAVVARTRPVLRIRAERRIGWQFAAVVRDLGEVETTVTAADLGEHAILAGRIATDPGVMHRQQRRNARHRLAFHVVANGLADVLAMPDRLTAHRGPRKGCNGERGEAETNYSSGKEHGDLPIWRYPVAGKPRNQPPEYRRIASRIPAGCLPAG